MTSAEALSLARRTEAAANARTRRPVCERAAAYLNIEWPAPVSATDQERDTYDRKVLGPPPGPRKQLFPVLSACAKHMRHNWSDPLDLKHGLMGLEAKTRRAKRFLQSREPKLTESLKNCMIIKGGNTSETLSQALKDVYALKKPNAVLYKKKNMVRPFEDSTALEFFSKKSDCSLFLFGSHNKKRPNNLIFGRMFDFHVLDMFELGVEQCVSLKALKKDTCPVGTKPLLVFAGELFDTDREHQRLKSVLTGLMSHARYRDNQLPVR
ncbi:hypothetical protein PO909_011121 [Leuciscus waleckii]